MNILKILFRLLLIYSSNAKIYKCVEKNERNTNLKILLHKFFLHSLSLNDSIHKNASIKPDFNNESSNSSIVVNSTNNSSKPDLRKHRNWHLINHESCGTTLEDRIVGGINASLGQYPWMARIGYINEDEGGKIIFSCGGSLISNDFVITAAHCLMNLPSSLHAYLIRLGEYATNTDIDCDSENNCADPVLDLEIDKFMVHNRFGIPLKANDIALVKLNKTITFTKWISPICLPFGSLLEKNLTGSKVDIAGWGFYDVTVPVGSTILQTIKLPVLESSLCIQKFRKYKINTTQQLCVGGERMKDSCNGDSGGPLMKVEVEENESPRFYQFGIVSFGVTYCGLTANPAVYTRLVNYVNWILDNMNTY